MAMKRKIKKRIIKKSKRVKKNSTQNHSGVLLEEMNSNLKLVLEGHAGLDKKIDGLRGEMNSKFDGLRGEMNSKFDGLRGEMNSKFDGLRGEMNLKFDKVDNNFKTVFEYLSKIDDELQFIKLELTQIKSDLKKKADLDYLKILEKRINKIEMDYIKLKTIVMKRK